MLSGRMTPEKPVRVTGMVSTRATRTKNGCACERLTSGCLRIVSEGWAGSSEKTMKLYTIDTQVVVVVVVVLLFYVHGKHLRSCRNGQLTKPHFSWAGLDLLSG